ncbi:MAG: hypothetical protein ACYCYO_21765 [Bacilli bacterium]
MQTFTGRLITERESGEQTAAQKEWTLEEIIAATQHGDSGIVSLSWYTIAGKRYKASSLSIGGGSDGYGIPRGQDGKLIVPTHFRRERLAEPFSDAGDPLELVAVEVEIDPTDIEYVTVIHYEDDTEDQPIVQRPLFIAVFADGGLITTVKTGYDLRTLILYMQHECDERFDSQTDDARIFDQDGDEVYVFPSPGELAEGARCFGTALGGNA